MGSVLPSPHTLTSVSQYDSYLTGSRSSPNSPGVQPGLWRSWWLWSWWLWSWWLWWMVLVVGDTVDLVIQAFMVGLVTLSEWLACMVDFLVGMDMGVMATVKSMAAMVEEKVMVAAMAAMVVEKDM